MLLNESEAIHRVLNGEDEAFSTIVELYEKTVFNIAFRMLREKEAALDISQEAFLQAYSNLPSFDGNRKLGPWLYRITHNKCLNYLKRNSHRAAPQSVSDDILATGKALLSYGESTTETVHKKYLLNELLEEVSQLPQIEKSTFMMKYLNEMPLKEISEILSIPVNTIKTHLFRARNKLRRQLKWWFNERE